MAEDFVPLAVRSFVMTSRPLDSFQRCPYGLRDDALAFGGWVDSVFLIEFVIASNTFEQKFDQSGFFGRRHFGEDPLEGGDVFRAHIVGHAHPGDDDFYGGIFQAGLLDDAGEVFFRFGGRDAAQAVIAAEGDDEHVGTLGPERPVDAAESSGGGVAADPGIHYLAGQAGGVEFFLEQRGIGFGAVQSVASGDAVAENDDADFSTVCINRSGGGCSANRNAPRQSQSQPIEPCHIPE